ncbi:MAG TPA: cysteine desulfurase-like protein [Saprospiraceae bacterium]|nr:cysteine desulfurase-like protein [Saprospiraceae bacterium]
MNTQVRAHFPSLSHQAGSRFAVFLDGPAGTQMPAVVIDAISNYYRTANANTHGQFVTSHETDELMAKTRERCASFLNAERADCISFGQNMTTLCFSLSRGIGRMLKPGDEIVITQLDHEANRGPWLTLQNRGVVVREIHLLPDGTLDYEDAAIKINKKTKLVAAGLASNMLGTVNNIPLLRTLSSDVGAWLLVDAVHSAPHFLTDVQFLGCDFLLCSAYKFYGPHVGILYSKPGLLAQVPVDRLRVQEQRPPYMIETGTLNHAAIAGVSAAIDFIASLGNGSTLRIQLENAFAQIRKHEFFLAQKLWNELKSIPGTTLYGQDFDNTLRAPTIAFTLDRMGAESVCRSLAAKGIFAWDGHFYAIRAAEILDLPDKGGVIRMGVVVYNTMEEIEYVAEQLESIMN